MNRDQRNPSVELGTENVFARPARTVLTNGR